MAWHDDAWTFIQKLLNPAAPYEQAAGVARDVAGQAKELSQLQFDRQMQGLGQAMPYMQNTQALYNQIFGLGNQPMRRQMSPLGGGGGAPTLNALIAGKGR